MKVAVVGAGVSGLSAVWALNEYSAHEVHLFEPLPWIGGHANTVEYTSPSGKSTPVDTGFIVFNKVTYPNFLRFLHLTGIRILDSDMSFSVTRWTKSQGYGSFEWAGGSSTALFARATNLFNPGHWRMVWDILRFNHQSVDFLRQVKEGEVSDQEISIGQWLDERGYSHSFRKNYLIPMTASIWSTAPETALASFPAITLLRFMHNHHLLQILDRPQWLTLHNGSKSYVERILSKLPPKRIHQGKDKGAIESAYITKDGKWTIVDATGSKSSGWDRVIFACHADTTVGILQNGLRTNSIGNVDVKDQLKVLQEFKFSDNVAVLHRDERLMPVRKVAWSAWNFLAETIPSTSSTSTSTSSLPPANGIASSSSSIRSVSNGHANGNGHVDGKQVANAANANRQEDVDRVSLTYWMNLLQDLPVDKYGPVLVTLNPSEDAGSPYTPRSELVVKRQSYTHPLYTPETVAAQTRLGPLQGRSGAYYAGAWTNYGFHEDGFSSGLRAAADIPEVYIPFDIRDAERKLPSTKSTATSAFELVDSAAKTPLVVNTVTCALLVLVHLLAVVQFFLSTANLAPHLTKNIATVKDHLRTSLVQNNPRLKAA
ncbi:FAD/NAD(P)-binding domain-containing protein [Testicularia cyperi]|uniref:FAD/NAD(P)-binding domain-containing protein n=1 Tax=Testicularia cyperi TaxID=1882483 RepID=A0A317XER9_9BASI|nr:FAD/NAD(P)-binding domain-containing protein [Testicularia cyperi]